MSFLHDQRDFRDLLQVVAGDTRLAPGLVEKDYWVTHVLWALQEQGFEVWFKGGTSLSKGFALIRRFSEDLDLKLMPGSVAGVPEVTSWTSEGTKATSSRKAYFEALEQVLVVSGATVTLDREQTDRYWRNAALRVTYPGHFLPDLAGDMRQYVLLEVGNARVTPAVQRGMSSFVHDFLDGRGTPEGVVDNRPSAVACVHPLVTLLEKLDAIFRRFPRAESEAAAFVRHYEDAAHIVRALDGLPPLEASAVELAAEMVEHRQLKALPDSGSSAFLPGDTRGWAAIRSAHERIGPMFWGPRVPIEEACGDLRAWVASAIEGSSRRA